MWLNIGFPVVRTDGHSFSVRSRDYQIFWDGSIFLSMVLRQKWSLYEHWMISSTVHEYKRNLAHINYNISSTLAATKLSRGTNNNNMLNYRSAKNRRYLLNSTFFRNLFFTKMCIIRAVLRNIHTQQIIILVTFHVLTIIDLSRTSILINQNYS